ncbi:MAG: VOC family protein [Trueperaceae bacterium]|nr:VOC family protein [Trueperaceae bacterium]
MRAHHLGLTIRDTERALAFYCGVLGATLLWRSDAAQEGPQTDRIFEAQDARVRVSGVDLHGLVVEFFEFLHPRVDEASFATSYRTGGWKHLAFTVDDIDDEAARLRAAGVNFRHDVQTLPDGTRMASFDDPDGVMLELNQPASGDRSAGR